MMQLLVLLNDHEELTHKQVDLQLDERTTLLQLKERISSYLNIEQKEMEVFFADGRRIVGIDLDSSLPQIGLCHMDKVIVKHALVETWAIFLERYKTLKRLKTNEEQGNMAHSLLGMLDILMEHKFFDCYVKFCATRDRIDVDVREYLGGFRDTIEIAARLYFFGLKKNNRSDPCLFKIRFSDKLTGVHAGRLCTVTDFDGDSKYFIKTNYGGPRKSSSRSGMAPNLREVFGYSLLELIGAGPESHFMCPPPGTSTRTIFIATKSVPDFDKKRLTSKSKNIKTILVEIHVLCSIFYITDVHEENCGELDGKPVVIDFAIPFREGYQCENVVNVICDGTPAPVDTLVNGVENRSLRGVMDECSSQERIEIARAAITRWNLMNAIENAKIRTDIVKANLRAQGIVIEKTEDFSKYVADVKYNCSLLL